MNVEKSTFASPALKSETVTITDAGGGAYHDSIDVINNDGSSMHIEFTAAFDGKDAPVAGSEDIDSVNLTQIETSVVKLVYKKAGKRVEWGTFRVSKSGKTMHGTYSWKDSGRQDLDRPLCVRSSAASSHNRCQTPPPPI